MALTLVEAAKLAADNNQAFRSGVIEHYAREAEILRVMSFMDIPGGAYRYNREDALPGVGFRGVNEAFSESTGVINPLIEPLAIAGGDLDVDKFIVDTQGDGVRTTHEVLKIKALAHWWQRTFVKGDSSADPREFDGLQKRIVGNQLMDAGATNGGDALSLIILDELIDLVDGPTHLIMNKTLRRRLTAAARSTTVGGFIQWLPDEFGRRVSHYNDLPILVFDEDGQGSKIFPFTEPAPADAAAATTSIYCVSIADGKLQGIQSAGIDTRDLGELQTKPVYRTRVDWNSGFAALHGKSVARLRGIKNAAVVA